MTPTRIAIVSEPLNVVTDPRIGVDPISEEDQGAKLQHAIDLAAPVPGTHQIYIPARCRVFCHQELLVPSGSGNYPVQIVGAGRGTSNNTLSAPSSLVFNQDLGAGKYAIKYAGGPIEIRDLTITGPNLGGPLTGATMSAMHGLLASGQTLLHRVNVGGFDVGVEVISDHVYFRDCDFGANGWGMDWADFHAPQAFPTAGDVLFDHVNLAGQKKGSIRIAHTNSIIGARFRSCHFGYAPYGIYRYTAAGSPNPEAPSPMQSVVFETCPFESCGHAAIYDNHTSRGFWSFAIDQGGVVNTPDGGFAWAGEPTNLANFEVGTAQFIMHDPQVPPAIGLPIIRAAGITLRADTWTGLASAIANNPSTTKPFVISGAYNPSGTETTEFVLGRGLVGTQTGGARVADTAITRGDLLMLSNFSHVKPYDGTAPPVGFAANTCVQGDVCVFFTRSSANGAAVCANKTAVAAFGAYIFVKPDPANAGGVIAATGPTDGLVVGAVKGVLNASTTTQVWATV